MTCFSSSPETESLSGSFSSQSTSPSPATWDDIIHGETEYDTLYNINRQLKATLTSMLNCPEVKKDERYERWVKERLMDTERERKMLRRMGRRGSAVSEQSQSDSPEEDYAHHHRVDVHSTPSELLLRQCY